MSKHPDYRLFRGDALELILTHDEGDDEFTVGIHFESELVDFSKSPVRTTAIVGACAVLRAFKAEIEDALAKLEP